MKPKLRFKGYDEDWDNKPLKELACFSRGQGYSKKDLVSNGKPIFLYGRLYTKYATFVYDIDTFANEQPNSILSKGNEVVMPSSGETAEDIAVASAIMEDNIILSGGLNIIIPNVDKLASDFLALNLTYGSPHFELAKKAQGKSVVHLYNSDISSINLQYPHNTKEQKEIGEYFRKLDGLIKETGKEIEKLENVKQASLQKMFPQPGESVPQLRFKGFTEPWEQKRLGELCDIYGRIGFRGYTIQDIVPKGKGAISLSPTNLINLNHVQYDSQTTYISFEKYKESPEIMIYPGDVVFVKTASIGRVAYIDHIVCETTINPQLVVLKKLKIDGYFLSLSLATDDFQNKVISISGGGILKTMSQVQLGSQNLKIPSLEEQKAIGEYFRNLDKMISAKKKKLEKLKQIKASCLNLMFV